MKMWEGRFKEKNNPFMEEFNRSLDFDKRLISEDITGNIAYAKALFKCGILKKQEMQKIIKTLQVLLKNKHKLGFNKSDEDVHMAVERLLTEKLGPLGGKIHTGRSRNDQIALDTRLYLKKEIDEIHAAIGRFMSVILSASTDNMDIIMPSFTHLQMAQPVLFSHYLLSWFFMLERDAERLSECRKRLDIMPLGSGALAGSGFDIDRGFIAKELGFARVTDNSMDSVSDRDYILEFMSAISITSMHLSRFAEDTIIFSSPGYGFFELSDAYSTGSSMMPNKKNPDSMELVRGKTGRIYGNLVRLLTVMKGLPLTYNKDLQEDKEALFDTIDTIKALVSIFTGVIQTITINKEKIKASLNSDMLATDLADALSKNGLPFRDAHKIVGRIVLDCKQSRKSLLSLTSSELKTYSTRFPINLKLSFKNSIENRSIYGGTGTGSVKAQIKKARNILKIFKHAN